MNLRDSRRQTQSGLAGSRDCSGSQSSGGDRDYASLNNIGYRTMFRRI